MNEIDELKSILQKYKSHDPPIKRYPEEFWVRIVKLASEIGNKRVVDEVGVSYGNMIKKVQSQKGKGSDHTKKKKPSVSFVNVPVKKSSKQIVLEFHRLSMVI